MGNAKCQSSNAKRENPNDKYLITDTRVNVKCQSSKSKWRLFNILKAAYSKAFRRRILRVTPTFGDPDVQKTEF